jgi:hypothetical protein
VLFPFWLLGSPGWEYSMSEQVTNATPTRKGLNTRVGFKEGSDMN